MTPNETYHADFQRIFKTNFIRYCLTPMKSKPMSIGLIGCGAVCGQYLKNGRQFPNLRFTACADLNPEAARAVSAQFGIPRVCSVPELLADTHVEVVLNLTIP